MLPVSVQYMATLLGLYCMAEVCVSFKSSLTPKAWQDSPSRVLLCTPGLVIWLQTTCGPPSWGGWTKCLFTLPSKIQQEKVLMQHMETSKPSQEHLIAVAPVFHVNTIMPKLMGVQGGIFTIPFVVTYFTISKLLVGPDWELLRSHTLSHRYSPNFTPRTICW